MTSRYWFTPDNSLDDSLARVARVQRDWQKFGFGDWAVTDKATGKFIGFAGLHYISGMEEVNLGYLLGRSSCGRGLGTEACLAVVEFGKAGLKQIVGVTHPENQASIRVLGKIGMKFWKQVEEAGSRGW